MTDVTAMLTNPAPRRNRWQRPLATVVLCGAMGSLLSGCFGVLLGGAVMGGVAANDRRTLGAQTDDKAIALKGDSRFSSWSSEVAHIDVTSFNRHVLLTGEVRDEAMRASAEREMRAIDGVRAVDNELIVASPATYSSRSNDTLITTKVKASLVDMKTISASSFKVVTERAVVYLMGRVTPREGQVGADVARGVGGVEKVVKMFDYITEEELKEMNPPQSPATAPAQSQ